MKDTVPDHLRALDDMPSPPDKLTLNPEAYQHLYQGGYIRDQPSDIIPVLLSAGREQLLLPHIEGHRKLMEAMNKGPFATPEMRAHLMGFDLAKSGSDRTMVVRMGTQRDDIEFIEAPKVTAQVEKAMAAISARNEELVRSIFLGASFFGQSAETTAAQVRAQIEIAQRQMAARRASADRSMGSWFRRFLDQMARSERHAKLYAHRPGMSKRAWRRLRGRTKAQWRAAARRCFGPTRIIGNRGRVILDDGI